MRSGRDVDDLPVGGDLHPWSALVLDFDGVLVDTEACSALAWSEMCDDLGVPFPRALWADCVGRADARELLADALMGTAASGVDRDALLEAWLGRAVAHSSRAPLRAGAADLLGAARDQGWRTAVASGASAEWVLGHLSRTGVIDDPALRPDVVVTGDGMPPKPAPDVYRAVMQRLQVAPEATIAVEDSGAGAGAAGAAGVTCVLVPSGGRRVADLQSHDVQVLPDLVAVRAALGLAERSTAGAERAGC